MKVEKIDYVWVVLSWVTVAVTFTHGCLSLGVIIVYVLMALTFLYHIATVKKRMSGTKEAIGEIKDYHTPERSKLYYPIVSYETETGRTVTSVYSIADREKTYEIGSSEKVCYDPKDPMFFYFADYADEMTAAYRSYIIYGAIVAFIMFLIVRAIFGG